MTSTAQRVLVGPSRSGQHRRGEQDWAAPGVEAIAQAHLSSLVALVVVGAGVLHAFWNAIAKHVDDRLVAFALIGVVLTGLTIASYTLIDGLGVRHSHNPLAYAALLFVLEGPVFPIVALVRRPPSVWRSTPALHSGLAAGALTFVAYSAVLWAQSKAPLAEVAALRETSVIAAALIGTFVLRERFGARRVASAVLVAAGIVLISR